MDEFVEDKGKSYRPLDPSAGLRAGSAQDRPRDEELSRTSTNVGLMQAIQEEKHSLFPGVRPDKNATLENRSGPQSR